MATKKVRTAPAEPSMFEESQSVPARAMNEVVALARLLVLSEQRTADAKAALAYAVENERRLREESLPCAMTEMGLSKMTLSTGEEISTALEVYASIPVASREKANTWLEENGFGGIIKTNIELNFGKGELEEAKTFYEFMATGVVQTLLQQHVDDLHARLPDPKDISEEAKKARDNYARAVALSESSCFSESEFSRSVHPQTLKSFLREQLRLDKVAIPLELFGARPVDTAKVKQPSK